MNDHTELIQKQRALKRYNRSGRTGIGTGTISLLMIFTVLCFATLALLSLSTAASDRRIQQRSFERTAALAGAEGRAAESIAALDDALAGLQAEAGAAPGDVSGSAWMQRAMQTAAGLGWEINEAAASCVWTEPMDRENNLVTTVRLDPTGESARFALTGQTVEFIGTWEPETEGGLWQPPTG